MSDPNQPTPEALIDAHLDGVLTDEQADALRAWLLADEDNTRLFAIRAQEHMHLRQIFSGDPLARLAEGISEGFAQAPEEALTLDNLSLLEDPSDDIRLVDLTERLDRERRRRHDPRYVGRSAQSQSQPGGILWGAVYVAGLAAAAVIALLLYPVLTATSPTTTPPPLAMPNNSATPAQSDTAAPAAPAALVASRNAQWLRGTGQVTADGSMQPGLYTLDAGHAQVVMADGASLIVEGPAQFSIDSGSHVTLAHGSLSAHVPQGAGAFSIQTPAGRVDQRASSQGLSLGLAVIDDTQTEVHVLAGRVNATLGESGRTRLIRAGQASRMSPTASGIETVPVQAGRFAQDWEQVERSVRVSDAVRYLYDTPNSVAPSDLEDNEVLFVLPERRGVEIPAFQVLCDFMEPGRFDRLPSGAGAAPAGAVVDSYLLHYDRVGRPGELIAVEGTIHFDRPIIGVIVKDDRIDATDTFFAVPGTRYPRASYAGRGFEGLERFAVTQDIVEISADRRTLTVRLATSTNIDQLRVLVEAAP